jgi:hypothetical protein
MMRTLRIASISVCSHRKREQHLTPFTRLLVLNNSKHHKHNKSTAQLTHLVIDFRTISIIINMHVSGFMIPAEKVATCGPTDTIKKAMDLMLEQKISAVVVLV